MKTFILIMIIMTTPVFACISNDTEQHKYDQLKIAVQEICPVSGKELGSMGDPVKKYVGKEALFFCCDGCAIQKIKDEHWTTIHNNFIKAQRICPVMEGDLPKKPKFIIVNGQIVYVCCPPCTKDIATNPQKYLKKVYQYYKKSLDSKK